MKTLKSILFGAALLVATSVANAKPNYANFLSKNDVVSVFTNAMVHGNLHNLDQALAKNVEYTMYRGSNTFKLNKQALLDSFKASENIEQSCQYTSSVVSEVDNTMVFKLEMKYEGYVRTNTITVKQQGADWKITKIETQNS